MIMIIKKDFNRNNNNESYFNEKELRNLHYNMNENIITFTVYSVIYYFTNKKLLLKEDIN